MLKAVIENNGKRAYFDFCTNKGFGVIINALKRIDYDNSDYYSIKAKDVNLRFTAQTERFHAIKDLVQSETSIHDIFIACQTLLDTDKYLLLYIEEKFKNKEIKSVIDEIGRASCRERVCKQV